MQKFPGRCSANLNLTLSIFFLTRERSRNQGTWSGFSNGKNVTSQSSSRRKNTPSLGFFLIHSATPLMFWFYPETVLGVLNYTEEEWVEIERSIQWMQKGRSCVRLPNISAALLSPNLCVDLSGKFTLWESNPPCGLPRETIPWLVHSVGLLF